MDEGLKDVQGAAGERAAQPAGSDWTFPTYVGHRRRLPPSDALFESGNEEREVLTKQAALWVAKDAKVQLAKEAMLGGRDLSSYLSHKFECAACHAALPTAHLLSCHISEMHDSFFAAQVARRMRVYCCLVEGCGRKFCTVEERKQHLLGHHRFPRNYNFDRIHLRRRKGQIRPLPSYQKASAPVDVAIDPATGRGDEDGDTVLIDAAVCAVPRALHGAVEGAGGGDVMGAGAQNHEEMVAGLSRLSVAVAQEAQVPQNISFGRHVSARGMPGAGRGRGAGARAPSQGATDGVGGASGNGEGGAS